VGGISHLKMILVDIFWCMMQYGIKPVILEFGNNKRKKTIRM
jgi:hypothetical protein